MKIITILGTRPEAIKLAPLIEALKKDSSFDHLVCSTGQHKEMLQQVFDVFDLKPDIHLDLMKPNQTLEELSASALLEVSEILQKEKPDLIIVQGDTTTAYMSALAAYYQKIKVAHVEAGLRTFDKYSPWPEEMNRSFIGKIADFHFAPTQRSQKNLLKENINPDNIFVTGNTVIDALHHVIKKIDSSSALAKEFSQKFSYLDPSKKLILVTGHRRENFEIGIQNLCESLLEISNGYEDVQIIYPVHLNPNVQGPVQKYLSEQKNIFLIPPQDYVPFIYLMKKAHFIISDSGGIQEETPSLRIPLLVTRDTTERPEVLEHGTALLVGREKETLLKEVKNLLNGKEFHDKLQKKENPFGDGNSSKRIVQILKEYKTRDKIA